MRFNLRIKVGNITFFGMISSTQRLEGISSRQPDGKHFLQWDIEHVTLQRAKEVLRRIQARHHLANIYIVSDKTGSYRAWCFNRISFPTLLVIQAESLSILDYGFFAYAVRRLETTLRIDKKKGRPEQKLIGVLESYPCPIPSFMKHIVYDTGLVKKGTSILLGGD
jgi:hypothetical protein